MKIIRIKTKIGTPNFGGLYLLAMGGNGKPKGILKMEIDDPGSYIATLFVKKKHRNKGIGRKLLKQAFRFSIKEGKSVIGLSVADTNKKAQKLYKRMGFRPYLKINEGYTQYVKSL